MPEFNSVLDFDVKILLLWCEFGVPRIVEGKWEITVSRPAEQMHTRIVQM